MYYRKHVDCVYKQIFFLDLDIRVYGYVSAIGVLNLKKGSEIEIHDIVHFIHNIYHCSYVLFLTVTKKTNGLEQDSDP